MGLLKPAKLSDTDADSFLLKLGVDGEVEGVEGLVSGLEGLKPREESEQAAITTHRDTKVTRNVLITILGKIKLRNNATHIADMLLANNNVVEAKIILDIKLLPTKLVN